MDNVPERVVLAPNVPRKCPECGDPLVIIEHSDLRTYYDVHADGTAKRDETVAGKDDDTIVLSCTNSLCAYQRHLRVKDGVFTFLFF